MSLIDQHYRKVPDYYPTMYRDGFTPVEIWYAHRRKTKKDMEAREAMAMKRRLAELEKMEEEYNDGYDLTVCVK